MPRINQLGGGKNAWGNCLYRHISLSLHESFPCQFFTYSISKELLTLGQLHYCKFRVRKLLFPCEESSFLKQCHFSAHCPGLLTPCLHCTWLPSFDQQIPLDDSNNAPLVPGKPTWCTKMLCNTKWLLPLVLLKSGNSSKNKFHLMLTSMYSGYSFLFFFFSF